jgi:ubiquinone/menaquinone biosynthesis C-methylase UbiE
MKVYFDRIARHYRWLEAVTFGRSLQRARCAWIHELPAPRRALIVGEGNGGFLCELLRVHPLVEIDCVDVSAQMLELARARVRNRFPLSLENVRFLQEDIETWSPPASYDLLVTHFLLDCFRRGEVRAIVEKLSGAASSGSIWLLADFSVPETPLRRVHALMWLRAMNLFFRCVTGVPATNELVDPSPYLETAGFACVGRLLSRAGMIKSELWCLNGD